MKTITNEDTCRMGQRLMVVLEPGDSIRLDREDGLLSIYEKDKSDPAYTTNRIGPHFIEHGYIPLSPASDEEGDMVDLVGIRTIAGIGRMMCTPGATEAEPFKSAEEARDWLKRSAYAPIGEFFVNA